ncbi:MAG: endonuclease/exonuclease/phosphatase family protein [Clostridia bacterium]|nr:endonuclease/exonuclease/phosphatase family protein [Clostridia bacterium]
MSSRIRLMSHNIWNRDTNSPEWEAMGEDCSAAARVSGLIRVYKDTTPDIIGCQESSALMADLLKSGFEDENLKYTLIWGRFTPIIYRADKFELIDSEFGTYPEKIEGFEGSFNDVRSKSWNLGVFRAKENGKVFIFATTHLWWKKDTTEKQVSEESRFQPHSNKARELQLAQLLNKVSEYREKYNCPAIVVGDMNTTYDSDAIQNALKLGFRHAHDIATEYSEERVGLHFCYPWGLEREYYDKPFENAIDHILVIGEEEGSVKRFERYSPEYYLTVSDHSPAYIDIEL